MRSIRRWKNAVAVCAVVVAGWCWAVPAQSAGEPKETLENRLPRLISQLGENDFHARQRAQEELLKIGFPAIDALTEACDHDDLEIAERARYLLKVIKVDLIHEGDPTTVRRHLENYETADPDGRVVIMGMLAKEPRDQGVEALCRLVCFEKSQALSRQAAIVVLSLTEPEPSAWIKRAKIITETIAGSRRPGAMWLKTYAQSATDPAAALPAWEKWITAEQENLTNTGASGEAALAALLRRQVINLEKLERRADALVAVRKLIKLEKGNPSTLAELIRWLSRNGSWEMVNEVAQKFERTIAQEPWLGYILADSRAKQGQTDAAEELAEKAYNSPPERREQNLRAHLDAAYQLQRLGRTAWAEREFKNLAQQPISRNEGCYARLAYAEMLHDLDRDAEAATILSAFTSNTAQMTSISRLLDREGRTMGSVLARRQYFKALGMIRDKQLAGAKALLEQAHAADATEADVLIALYRLSADDAKERAKVRKKIDNAAAQFRQLIEDDSDSPTGYNQLAWLIANTEGDYDEALRCSLKSLELAPGAAGYLDTLGHCYFAKKDYANAIATQSRAVELEPSSGSIRRALERFQAAAAEKK